MKKAAGTVLIAFALVCSLSSFINPQAKTAAKAQPKAKPKPNAAATTTSKSKAGKPYPATVEEEFVKSCAEDTAATPELCKCMLEKIEAKYTLEQFIDISLKMNNGETPAGFQEFLVKAAVDCYYK